MSRRMFLVKEPTGARWGDTGEFREGKDICAPQGTRATRLEMEPRLIT